MNREKRKRREVILWGASDFTKSYLELTKESNINVLFIIDSNQSGIDFEGYKVISPEEYAKKSRQIESIPLVATKRSYENKGDFIKTLSEMSIYSKLENMDILHPSFLVDHIDLDYSEKAFIFTCNRAGSTLLWTIIERLLNKKSNSKLNNKEYLFEVLAREHFDTLIDYLDKTYYNVNASFTAAGATSFKNIDYYGCKHDNFFFINPIRANRYIFDNVHRSCSKPEKSILDLIKKKKYKLFAPIRNPLDIIVSNAFEIEFLLIKMFSDRQLDRTESSFRNTYGASRLGNIEWVESIAIYIKDFYEHLLNNIDNINTFKYEDIITEPIKSIHKISSILDVKCSENDLRDLWKEIGFKPLTKYKVHMFRPGADKWKQYLTKEHIDLLKYLRYDELLKELGYNIDLKSYTGIPKNNTIRTDPQLDASLSIGDYLFNAMFETPICFRNDNMFKLIMKKEKYKFNFVTNNLKFVDTYTKLLFSNMFKKIISSLDI
ncbi:MAG: sulfotransferase domain-containing protein [Mariniphaga sp.]|nr:sulfotransferase domain-containing protein [Mariniphaga sp.]